VTQPLAEDVTVPATVTSAGPGVPGRRGPVRRRFDLVVRQGTEGLQMKQSERFQAERGLSPAAFIGGSGIGFRFKDSMNESDSRSWPSQEELIALVAAQAAEIAALKARLAELERRLGLALILQDLELARLQHFSLRLKSLSLLLLTLVPNVSKTPLPHLAPHTERTERHRR
jgi:hypothetical protein